MASNDKERVVVIGFGWVGQANAIALHRMGHQVSFFDISEKPDPHYPEARDAYAAIPRIVSLEEVDSPDTYFIVCVGDRVSEEREQDIENIKKACEMLRERKGIIILRSTVLPQKLKELHFHIYMPEFLHEKQAIEECIVPHYFVVGFRKEVPIPSFFKEWEAASYKSFKGTPEEASYIKYLSNIWNSVRIAFVNEIGDSIKEPQTDEDVRTIERIVDFIFERKSYLRYGQGFDGHCLPKDTRAYIGAHLKEGKHMELLAGAYASNERHKELQARTASLPKVFSFWERAQAGSSRAALAWARFNQLPHIQRARKKLRFVVDALGAVTPERSLEQSNAIWEEKAKEHALYYANQSTKSGVAVTEEEVSATGQHDYETLVRTDSHVSALTGGGKRSRALDFGSGVGRMTVYFAHDFSEAVGLDVSPSMIEVAKRRVDDPRVRFVLYDGGTLPFEDGSFDLVFSYRTLQHIPTKKAVEGYLREFHRVLAPNGIAKVQLRGGRGVKRWEWSYGVSYTVEEASELARKVGFTVQSAEVSGIKNIWLTLKK